MAVGKEIKVTLSLDDSGFSVKTKVVTDNVRNLKNDLGGLTSQVGNTEKAIKGAGKSVEGFADGFSALQKSLAASVATLTSTVANSFTQLSTQSKAATKQVQDQATAAIDAKMRTLKAEVDTNRQILQSRAKLYNDLKKAETESKGRAIAAGAAKDARRDAYMKAPIGTPGASYANYAIDAAALDNEIARHRNNAEVMGLEALKVEELIAATRAEQAARQSNIASLEAERAAAVADALAKKQLAEVSAAVGKSNANTVKGLQAAAVKRNAEAAAAEKKAAEDGAKLAKQLSNEQIAGKRAEEAAKTAAAREAAAERRRIAAEEARAAKAESQAIANMWKGMAKMYAGSKIEQGVGASVGAADKYERESTTAQALNLSAKELTDINSRAWDDSKALKFVSALDMIQARLAAIGGMGGNNVPFIDKTLQYATTAAHNMQYITGDKSPEGMRDMVRNIYGVIEARQQTSDPEAAKRTIDLIQKMYVGTGKKIDIKDLETYLRRDNTGADKISDQGIANVVAFLDQAKVSGGGMGGAGVSTVGTMVKMFQKMANGGTMTVGGAQQFAEAGLMDLSVMDGKQGKSAMRALRTGGLNVAAMANEDPVKALEMISKAALTYMTKPANLKKYFPDGADPKDPSAIKNAMMKFATGTGWSTNAVAMLATAGNAAAMERAHTQANTVMNAKNTPEMAKDVSRTYGANMDKFNASLENLKIAVGNSVLPMLSKLMDNVSGFIDTLQEFAQNNPIATAATTIGASFAGVVMTVQGFLSMFGSAGVLGALRSFIGLAPAVGAGTGLMGTALSKLGTIFKGVMMVFLAWDVGYMFGTWASQFEAGGITIGQHMTNMFTRIEVGYKKLMLNTEEWAAKARNFLHIDDNGAYEKKLEEIGVRRAALAEYEHTMLITPDDNKRKRDVAPQKNDPATTPAPKAKADPKIKPPNDDQLAAIKAASSGEKGSDEQRDPLNKALSEELGRMNAAKAKLDALVAGGETVDSLRQQAIALVQGKLEADDLSKDHLKKNRPKLGMEDPTVKRLVEATQNAMLYNEQQKAIEYANERVAATSADANAAMARLGTEGAPKQSDAFLALEREMVRLEARVGAGVKGFKELAKAKQEALFNQSIADAGNWAAGIKAKNDNAEANTEDDDLPKARAKAAARLAVAAKVEDAEYQLHVASINKQRDKDIEAATDAGDIIVIKTKAAQAIDEIDQIYAKRKLNRDKEYQKVTESAVDKMAEDWKKVGKAMDDIGVNAMNGFVSMIMQTLSTGRLEIGNFLKGVLTDIANAKLKESLADPLKQGINAGMKWVGSSMFGFANGGIMTDAGPVELRKYANGGIATGPQLALYGEAGMNEAYVPLPDGRTIPVTLKGGGAGGGAQAPSVSVNVINQTSQQVNAQQGGMRFDGKQYVLDVVMTAATSPGPFRNTLKDALK